MRMKNKDKADFESFVVQSSRLAAHGFSRAGYSEAEDMAQEVAIHLSAKRLQIVTDEFWREKAQAYRIEAFRAVAQAEGSRKRGLKLMDLESAAEVPDVSTPYHFLIAQEIAGIATSLDLDSLMMGDTLEDEAFHHGVTRQRAHQIVNSQRSQMSEYLQA